ncbi:lipoyl synthase [Candidatus Woesearchaeota archaeon]|nr:lipoyl synthase [Candidatus Woesearchaeota archaeon]
MSELIQISKKPSWFKVQFPDGQNYREVRELVKQNNIHTICQEGKCPNIGDCWNRRTASFMLLGDTCTRACRYCNVKTGNQGQAVDPEEPRKVAESIKVMGIKYAVITSVDRDDLEDGGASQYIKTIEEIRKIDPTIRIELLTPDYKDSLKSVVDARPDVFGHNIETVRRVHKKVRAKGDYDYSLELLRKAKEFDPKMITKSGMMVGLGETNEEILSTLKDLREQSIDIVTIGQYLRPTERHEKVHRYVTPDEFKSFEQEGKKLGFKNVFSGPLVRSSFHADELVNEDDFR